MYGYFACGVSFCISDSWRAISLGCTYILGELDANYIMDNWVGKLLWLGCLGSYWRRPWKPTDPGHCFLGESSKSQPCLFGLPELRIDFRHTNSRTGISS